MKTAIVTGITGQDGRLMLNHLLKLGTYKVFGFYRPSSSRKLSDIFSARTFNNPNLVLVLFDLTSMYSLIEVLNTVKIDEFYHFADQDNTNISKHLPEYSVDTTVKPVSIILDTIMKTKQSTHLFIPSSSTIFGEGVCRNQNSIVGFDEYTSHNPESPYAIAKCAVYHLCNYYREKHRISITCGIMFGHDSRYRNTNYVLHNIAWQFANLITVTVKNPLTYVDIGSASEYVKIIHELVEMKVNKTLVIGTGKKFMLKDLILDLYRKHRKQLYNQQEESIETQINQIPLEERFINYSYAKNDQLAMLKTNYFPTSTAWDILVDLVEFYNYNKGTIKT